MQPPQLTLEWFQKQIGALYIANAHLTDLVQQSAVEITALQKQLAEKEKEKEKDDA